MKELFFYPIKNLHNEYNLFRQNVIPNVNITKNKDKSKMSSFPSFITLKSCK